MKVKQSELDFWGAYVKHLANRMGLSEWELAVHKDTALDLEDVIAQVKISRSRHSATIGLSKHFLRHAPDWMQRDTVVHELIHCHLYQVEQHLDLAFDLYPEKNLITLLKKEINRSMEFAIDDMALAWAKHFPTPNQFRSRASEGKTGVHWVAASTNGHTPETGPFGDPVYAEVTPAPGEIEDNGKFGR
jgi:hypothetical protein